MKQIETLIGMREFLLKENIKHNGEYEGEEMLDLLIKLYGNSMRYANFISQTPKLGHFIPCDENDVHLVEPKDYLDIIQQGSRVYHYDDIKLAEEYQQAFIINHIILTISVF